MQQFIAKPDQIFMLLMVSNEITTKWERKKIGPVMNSTTQILIIGNDSS